MRDVEKQLKALANRRRLAILLHLRKVKVDTVGNIAEAIKLSFKATSKHIAVLKAAGMLDYEQEGLEYHYYLAKDFPPIAKAVLAFL